MLTARRDEKCRKIFSNIDVTKYDFTKCSKCGKLDLSEPFFPLQTDQCVQSQFCLHVVCTTCVDDET